MDSIYYIVFDFLSRGDAGLYRLSFLGGGGDYEGERNVTDPGQGYHIYLETMIKYIE